MKKYTLLILFTLLSAQTLFAATNASETQVKESTPQMRIDDNVQDLKTQNRKIVTLVVKELSRDLPKRVDQFTEFVSIRSDGLTLIYIFEINTGAKSDEAIIKEDHSRMREAVTQGVCRSSQRFLDAQINISYLYQSAKSKKKLFQFDITQTDCTKDLH